jgi:hypothetical protein
VLNADRVETLVNGARRYAATVRPVDGAESADGGAGAGEAPQVEAAADALLDVLLARQPSPLQNLIIEQTALVLGAASRETWAKLRKRSGTLGSRGGGGAGSTDRSVLGALVDPLGLFRGSALVQSDARDAEALAAAARLVSIASDLGVSSAMSAAEQRRLAGLLLERILDRRSELRLVTRKLLREFLAQSARRVERGR